MAVPASKDKKRVAILVSTKTGEAHYRYVSKSNLSEYGKVGRQQGQSIFARKQNVEVQQGEIKKKALPAKKLATEYRKGPQGIFYKPTAAPPPPKPAPDIDEDIQRDMADVQERYNPPPKPVPVKATTAQASRPIRQLPPQDIMSDPDVRQEERRLTGRPIEKDEVRGVRIQSPPPPETRPQIQRRSEGLQTLGEAKEGMKVQKKEDWIIVENVHGRQLYDSEGNPLYDEEGRQVRGNLQPFIAPEKRETLYAPVTSSGGQTLQDERGYRVYRRTKAVVSTKIERPAGSQISKPLDENVQIVIEGTVVDENGQEFQVIGRSHTLGGAKKFGHGYTDSSATVRYEEAIISLKKNMHEQGISYENSDKILADAFANNRLTVEEHLLYY